MTLDTSRPVRTRDGRKARIIADNIKHVEYPIVAAVTNDDDSETVHIFTSSGAFLAGKDSDDFDLVNVPNYSYKLLYKYGACVPSDRWFDSKERFARYDMALRMGWLVRENGSDHTTVYEPI